ncbi:MAG TPA: metal ABC transporter permease, partial [Geminicoccaceae bacterium]|nr:metal ABC transporter permease [Geminicoccaceae bacterium]
MGSLTPIGLDLPTLGEVVRVLAFRSGYNTSVVLLGVTLLGVAAGVVGTFAMLRKRALMSDALSHASLPGIALAFLIATALGHGGRNLWLLLAGAA